MYIGRGLFLESGGLFGYDCGGADLRKEGAPMRHFLRDVLAAFVAPVLAALVIRMLNI